MLELAAQGCGRVLALGGFPDMFRCGAKRHGLLGNIGDRLTVGLDDPRGLGDSTILI